MVSQFGEDGEDIPRVIGAHLFGTTGVIFTKVEELEQIFLH